MRANLHTHTTFSDGELSIDELAIAAIEKGITHLAITDHFETTKLPRHLTVRPEQFEDYRRRALAMGFLSVASGPFVRSSYNAKEVFDAIESQPSKG